MATLKSKTLFFVTSPRSPMKMIPEISILANKLSGEKWDKQNQQKFIQYLAQDKNFKGTGSATYSDFSARDRINRGPKALGFIDLKPTISLTAAGKNFLNNDLAGETLLRQLLKFQLPSPYHTESKPIKNIFFVKPYLEIFRLIHTLEYITFDELMIFGLQLTNYNKFDNIVEKIKIFRKKRKTTTKSYNNFMREYQKDELKIVFEEEIKTGHTRTRESRDISIKKFIKTKANNMRDYTDACFRYLQATGLVSISQKGKYLSIPSEKTAEVEFFLQRIDRNPTYVSDESAYKAYLFDETLPKLYTDNREHLELAIQDLEGESKISPEEIKATPTIELKKRLQHAIAHRKEKIINNQIIQLKTQKHYADIKNTFCDIINKDYYDNPLMLEWNTWRAMTMLNGGNIKANLKFDDNGQPIMTAPGNTADIVCDYGDFYLAVEVTMQSGQRQYEMEGEPVARHLANIKKEYNKSSYCFFIAPTINKSCIAHFYTLHIANISYYGGKSVIIPLELDLFQKMLEKSTTASDTPTPQQIKKFCDFSLQMAETASDENQWYEAVKQKALAWPAI